MSKKTQLEVNQIIFERLAKDITWKGFELQPSKKIIKKCYDPDGKRAFLHIQNCKEGVQFLYDDKLNGTTYITRLDYHHGNLKTILCLIDEKMIRDWES